MVEFASKFLALLFLVLGGVFVLGFSHEILSLLQYVMSGVS